MNSLLAVLFGASLVLVFWVMTSWIKKKQVRFSWLSWMGIGFSTVLGFFSLAWTVSCVLEKETKAAAIGLVIFGGLTFILSGLTRRRMYKEIRSQSR